MFRRTFLRKTFPAAVLASSATQTWLFHHHNRTKKLIKPAQLRAGATVALIAPASPATEAKFEKAFANLAAMGFKVKPGTHLKNQYGYLAGTDTERAADIMAAFTDPEVEAIWCVRGGYGCTRLLPLLDYALIREHPKLLIGYSDITALHLALYQKAGLVSFHGQVGGGDMTPFTTSHIQSMLFEAPRIPYPIEVLSPDLQKSTEYEPFTIKSGAAEGPLTGGNLSLLAAMTGTPYGPVFKDHIVFIEEISEAPYRVDRLLTQLLQGSDLPKAKGIILGIFNDCIQKGDTPTLTIRECLTDCLGGLGIPVYYGAPFGHIADQCVLPYGINARMDGQLQQLILLQPAVQ